MGRTTGHHSSVATLKLGCHRTKDIADALEAMRTELSHLTEGEAA
jgi:hypothetical protein